MESILGFPDPIVASREPKRNAVTEEMAVHETYHEAGPVNKCEGSVLCDSEAVDAAGLEWHLQPDWRQGVEGNVEAEGYGVEASDDEDDRREHHLEW